MRPQWLVDPPDRVSARRPERGKVGCRGGQSTPAPRTILSINIRDSVTWDNCRSAGQPLSFASPLDGDQRLAGAWQEGDARELGLSGYRKRPG